MIMKELEIVKERFLKKDSEREIERQIESKRLKEEACRDMGSHFQLFSPIFAK